MKARARSGRRRDASARTRSPRGVSSGIRRVSRRSCRSRTDCRHRHQLSSRHPQVRQREQRQHLRRVLRQAAVAHPGVAELALHHPERVLHLRPQAGLEVLPALGVITEPAPSSPVEAFCYSGKALSYSVEAFCCSVRRRGACGACFGKPIGGFPVNARPPCFPLPILAGLRLRFRYCRAAAPTSPGRAVPGPVRFPHHRTRPAPAARGWRRPGPSRVRAAASRRGQGGWGRR